MGPAVFASCHVEIGGLRFHYTDWGGDGPPLVMLHGLSGHARTWDYTAAPLAAATACSLWTSAATATPTGHRSMASLRWHKISWASSTLWICAK